MITLTLPLFLGGLLAHPLQSPSHEPAPIPRFAGTYRPAEGFLSYRRKARSGPERIFTQGTGEILGWLPLAQGKLWEQEVVLQENPGQINGFVFTYASSHPDPTGRAGSLNINFGLPNGKYRQLRLQGLPLGGRNGELLAWKVLVDLTNGYETLFETSVQNDQSFAWSMETLQPNTGPCVKIGDAPALLIDIGTQKIEKQASISLALELLTLPPGVTSYAAKKPGSADRLQLRASKLHRDGSILWDVVGKRKGRNYLLVMSESRCEISVGDATILVEETAQSRVLHLQEESLFTHDNAVHQPRYIQVLEFDGTPSVQNLTGASQGLCYINLP
jgi:hypothetical protein